MFRRVVALLVLAPVFVVGCKTEPTVEAASPAAPEIQGALTKKMGQGVLGPDVPDFWIRPGWRCDLVASNFGIARFMAIGEDGTLYVSQWQTGTIAALKMQPDGRYKKVGNFIEGKYGIHGIQFKDGWLWFGQSDHKSGTIWKARCTNGTGVANELKAVVTGLPTGGHWWRSILVDDDGFYTSIGDSANASDEINTDRQKIWHYDLEGGHKELFASGLRNTEKLLFRPGTKEVWGMDHGSDAYGTGFGEVGNGGKGPITEEVPGEKLNHYVKGGFYGHPFFVGGRYPRMEYAKRPDLKTWADKVIMPAYSYGAHWAPDGWCFYTGDKIPDAKGDAFMSFHGSWDRVHPGGYQVGRTFFDKVTGQPYGYQTIVSTLSGDKPLARPDDVIQAPDGSLLWASDQGGWIFRLTYTG